MTHASDLIATDIDAYLAQHERKELLRFLTCGSVDDGKSTLIGTLLIESHNTFEDQIAQIEKDSQIHGTLGGKLDPALLMDGLKAEREQGITIDVSYRYFSTSKRKFIIADTPGHEQYTRNMATGASTCDLAIILIDARHGVVTQTKRHSFITSLLGIRHIVVAINKMDLVDYSQETYEKIRDDYESFAAKLSSEDVHFLPISALNGDNVVHKSDKMPWYEGSPLMYLLDNVSIASDRNLQDFRFPVQYVNRPHLNFRGFCGTVASGIVRPGDEVMVLPSRKTSRVKEVVAFDGNQEEAFPPQAVTLTLEDEIDVSRGDMIVRPGNVPRITKKVDAMVVWMDDAPLVAGKAYMIKHSTKVVSGTMSRLQYRIDVNTLHRADAPKLGLNEIGRCTFSLTEPLAVDAYKDNKGTGSMIIVDRITNVTVGAAMILHEMGEARDHWDDEPTTTEAQTDIQEVSADERQARFGQSAATILLTGLTGSGKSTLARAIERKLFNEGHACAVLDGQNLRTGISKDLGFTADERSENLRRGVEIAQLMNGAGLIVVCAFVAPSASVRDKAKAAFGTNPFIEVHLAAPVEVCRQRDIDEMYARADSGEIKNFPGVSSDYDEPAAPDLRLATDTLSVDECVEQVVGLLSERGLLG